MSFLKRSDRWKWWILMAHDLSNIKIAIIGLGYVGLPLAVAFAGRFPVVGYDINDKRVGELREGEDLTLEVPAEKLATVADRIRYSSTADDMAGCNVFIVTVPTPIDSSNRPDLSPLIASSRTIGGVVSKGDIVIYESTVYPGVTENICIPAIEAVSGLKFNEDFFAGYSPERINPGDRERTIEKIIKVTSGSTAETAKLVDELYKSIIEAGTFPVSSIKVAEASKIIENTQRDVNIALINELALIFDHMNIDTLEVIEAAGTKWNFLRFKPGLVGGHCIGVDPYYLTFRAEEMGYRPNLILSARQINNGMGKYIAGAAIKQMIQASKVIQNAKVLIMGLTFKEDCPDVRNTRVSDIIDELQDYGVDVDVYDPWVEGKDPDIPANVRLVDDPFQADKLYDGIIVAVAHSAFNSLTHDDYRKLSNGREVLIDVKGVVPAPTWRL